MDELEYLAAIQVALKRDLIDSADIVCREKSYKNFGPKGGIFLCFHSGSRIGLVDRESIQELITSDPSIKENLKADTKELSEEELAKRKEEEEQKIKTLVEKGMRLWEYKHIRLDYKGRGITQEINILDIDGERLRGWSDNFSSKENEVPTLPELLERLGNQGWEMISHVVNQDLAQNGVTMHYYNFKREKL
mgnify:FL=1